jgi:tetratricopeptide (TPR) repeat protein
VAQQDSATTTAKSDQTAIAPPNKSVTPKVTPQKTKPKPAPVKEPAVDDATDNAMQSNTSTVFEGKDIDIEQFDQASTSPETESDPFNSTTESLADNDSPANNNSETQGTANFLPTPQDDQDEAAEFTAAETSSSSAIDTPSDSTATDNTQVATLEKSPPPTETTNGENYLQVLLDKSLQSFENKQWKTLIELSNEILAIDPSTVTALTNRAAANTELGDFAAALADCNKAIKIESENPLAINNRGYVYEKMGDFQNAILDYQNACSLGVALSCKEAKRLKKESKQ